jgi:hypothetical protein
MKLRCFQCYARLALLVVVIAVFRSVLKDALITTTLAALRRKRSRTPTC